MRPNWFVGLPVATADWLEPLLRDAPPSLRLFHPNDVHITVAFLGACGEKRARNAWDIAAHYDGGPVEVTLGTLKPFGNPRRPSALSVVLTGGHDQAVALIVALRARLIEAAGATADSYEPKPHITVARPPKRATGPERRAAVRWAESEAAIGSSVTLDRLALYTWSEDRRTRQFRQVEARRLKAR